MQMKSVEKYRIMGIDPGTNYMGYGVLEIEGRTVRSVVLGDIDLHKLPDPYAKLRYIFERVGALSANPIPIFPVKTPPERPLRSRHSQVPAAGCCSTSGPHGVRPA